MSAGLKPLPALQPRESCASATEALGLYAQAAEEAALRWGKANPQAVLAALILRHDYGVAEIVRRHLVEAGVVAPVGEQ